MLASKENAIRAMKLFSEIAPTVRGPAVVGKKLAFIGEFLDATQRRLPTEASYKRDRDRKKPATF